MTIIDSIVTVVAAANGCTTDYVVGQLPQYTRRQVVDALRLSGHRYGLRLFNGAWWKTT